MRKCGRACDQLTQFTNEQHERIMEQEGVREYIRIFQERIRILELRDHEQPPEYLFDDERTVELLKLIKA